MTRPTQIGRGWPVLEHGLASEDDVGSEPAPDCCDPVDPADVPDRAAQEASTAVTLSEPTTPTLVQVKTGTEQVAGTVSITFDAAPTPGSLLVMWHTCRSSPTPLTPSGWTAHPSGTVSDGTNNGGMFYRISDGTETTITADASAGTRHAMTVAEFGGSWTLDTSAETTGSSATLTTGSVTPTASETALIVGGATSNVGDAIRSVTPGSGWTELGDTMMDGGAEGGFHPLLWMAYRIEASASGSYDPTGTATASGDFGGQTLAFTGGGTDPAWNIPTPAVIDGDDATYHLIPSTGSSTDVLRIDLGAAYRIVRSRLRIGCQNAGAKSYTIKGANLPDFSDEVTLATEAFTGTGSYTAQDVDFLWDTTESYRYFELSGTSESRRIYAWELYEETPGTNLVTDPTNGDAVAELQVVLDNLYDAIAVGAALDDLTDVVITSPTTLDHIYYNGTAWVNTAAVWSPVSDGAGGVLYDAGTGAVIMAFGPL